MKVIKNLIVIGVIMLVLNFSWHFVTDSPSTESVCYTWSKATDPFTQGDEYGLDGAQWLADNLKTEKDFENIDPEVLSAMRLYDTGASLEDVDANERFGLKQFVLDACEKSAPGSTKHS
jgi:hypothetical protein